jgi:hypothetical protein
VTGLILRSVMTNGQRTLKVESLSQLKLQGMSADSTLGQGSFQLFIPTHEANLAPLISWLESPVVRRWVDHLSERKGDRWLLTEQIIKYIPVPRQLLKALGFTADPRHAAHSSALMGLTPLSPDWEEACSRLFYEPKKVLEKLRNELAQKNSQSQDSMDLRTQLFVHASQAAARLRTVQNQIQSVVDSDGHVRWAEVMKVLPKSEITLVAHHSSIQLKGALPLQTTILQWERVKSPTPGVLFSSESGNHLHVGCESPRQIDIILDQLRDVKHPTWAELVPWLKLPRDISRAEHVANDFLHNWHEQKNRAQEIQELLDETLAFWAPSAPNKPV